jgi:hypothetical protein
VSVAQSLTGGYHLAFEIGAIAIGVGLALSFYLLRSPPEALELLGEPESIPKDQAVSEMSDAVPQAA